MASEVKNSRPLSCADPISPAQKRERPRVPRSFIGAEGFLSASVGRIGGGNVERKGVEPSTSSLRTTRSSQLSYRPKMPARAPVFEPGRRAMQIWRSRSFPVVRMEKYGSSAAQPRSRVHAKNRARIHPRPSAFIAVHLRLKRLARPKAAPSRSTAHRPRLRLEGHLEGRAFALQQSDAAVEL